MTPPPVVPAGNGQQDGQSLDELVMGTNSSSIVSKRSVEKLYYPDEPHFYRFFVPRFQRRAPLVNRGYHLRIKVIDTIVRTFYASPQLAGDTMFVDVDFPDLMERKRNIVLAHPELSSLLGSSCPSVLQDCLSKVTGADTLDVSFLFVAEVSITYLETRAADEVIRWASSIGSAAPRWPGASFCKDDDETLQQDEYTTEASNKSTGEPSTPRPPQEQPSTLEKWRIAMRLDEPPKGVSLRRFGAAVQIAVPERPKHLCHILGQGPGSRLSSLDVHSISEEVIQATSSGNGPSQRVCFTLTDLGSAGVMLAGGRASPTAPSKETWIYTASSGRWYRSHDLPMPSFRHSAVRLGSSSLALVVGGKTDKHSVATACHVFDPKIGWRTCKLRGTCPAVFGATLIDCPKTNAAAYTGALIGGMHEDGTCNQSTFFWELDMDGSSDLSISFRRGADADPSLTGHHSSLHRFGANCLPTPDGCFLLFGGVTAGSQLPQDQDILVLKMGANGFNAVACLVDVDEKRSYWSRGTYSIVFDTANDMVGEPAAGKAAPLPVRYAHTNDI
ncbi:leucine carboxyl methyltransferase [Verticillium dahliae]|nr:leucine carboxyl methyltransferase [Verticillium dahliae]